MDEEEMYSPGYEEDMSDAELDAIVAAAEDRLLTAIHDSLDLDAGLAKITGDPPRREADAVTEAPSVGVQTLFASPSVEDQCLRFPQVADITARDENAVKGAATPTTMPPSSSGSRAETVNHVIMVLGDTSIEAFTASGILETNESICAVLASTERATIEELAQPGGFRSRFPERVFTAYLKPAPPDFAQAREELMPWLTPRRRYYRLTKDGAEGALDRADAATRLLLSEDFSTALDAALIWAHARPIQGIHLAVGVIGFAVAERMTGSGILMAAVDLIEKKLVDFVGTADEVWIDLLIGAASIHQRARREFEDARADSMALIAELGAAVADPAVAGPSGLFGTHLGQILVLGPPEGGGTLRDAHEANASLQLALAIEQRLFGGTRSASSTSSYTENAGRGLGKAAGDRELGSTKRIQSGLASKADSLRAELRFHARYREGELVAHPNGGERIAAQTASDQDKQRELIEAGASSRYRRPPRLRLAPLLIFGAGAILLLYFLPDVTNVNWTSPVSVTPVFAVVLAAMVGFAFFRFTPDRVRRRAALSAAKQSATTAIVDQVAERAAAERIAAARHAARSSRPTVGPRYGAPSRHQTTCPPAVG